MKTVFISLLALAALVYSSTQHLSPRRSSPLDADIYLPRPRSLYASPLLSSDSRLVRAKRAEAVLMARDHPVPPPEGEGGSEGGAPPAEGGAAGGGEAALAEEAAGGEVGGEGEGGGGEEGTAEEIGAGEAALAEGEGGVESPAGGEGEGEGEGAELPATVGEGGSGEGEASAGEGGEEGGEGEAGKEEGGEKVEEGGAEPAAAAEGEKKEEGGRGGAKEAAEKEGEGGGGTYEECIHTCAAKFGLPPSKKPAGAAGAEAGGEEAPAGEGEEGGEGAPAEEGGEGGEAFGAAEGGVAEEGAAEKEGEGEGEVGGEAGGVKEGEEGGGAEGEANPAEGGAEEGGAAEAEGGEAEMVGKPGQIVVAPKAGDLRMVPFNTVAKKGEKVEFVWGAGPHTVTQSSALSVCNKTLDEGAFKASGMQGEGFRMEIEIEDESKPIWFYCSVKDHCQKGMFGVINMPLTEDPEKMLGGKMEEWGKVSTENQDLIDITVSVSIDSDSRIKQWGERFDASAMPEWARPMAMQEMLKTRQYYAKFPQQLLASPTPATNPDPSFVPPIGASSTGSSSPSSSTSSSPLLGESAASPSAPLSLAVLLFFVSFAVVGVA